MSNSPRLHQLTTVMHADIKKFDESKMAKAHQTQHLLAQMKITSYNQKNKQIQREQANQMHTISDAMHQQSYSGTDVVVPREIKDTTLYLND